MSGKHGGKRVKVVKRKLADGSVKEYRYDLDKKSRERFSEQNAHAIHKIANAYLASPEFKRLSPSWQAATRGYISLIETELGWMGFQDLGLRKARQKFYELRDSLASTPVKADRTIGVLKVLMAFAYERDAIEADHARGIPRLSSDKASRSENVFSLEQESALLSLASTDLSNAIQMALYTAARVSDLIGLKWENLDSQGWLTFRPAKTAGSTGAVISLPAFAMPPLANLLASLPRTSGHILTNQGQPWKRATLFVHWNNVRSYAGITDLRWHDWRGTAVTRMLEAGCTAPEAAAITGHSLVRGAMQKYAARTNPLALNAYTKWWASMQPGKVVHLSLENALGKRGKTLSQVLEKK